MTNRKYKAEKLQHVEYDKQINIQDLVLVCAKIKPPFHQFYYIINPV